MTRETNLKPQKISMPTETPGDVQVQLDRAGQRKRKKPEDEARKNNHWGSHIFVLRPPLLSGAQSLKTVRATQAPKLDGDLSDEVWKSAEPYTGFLMVEPKPNQEPTERTELRILYDESNLYIGVRCYDSEPSRIAANSMAMAVERRYHPGAPRPVPGQAQRLHLLRESARRSERRPGVRRT